MVTEKFSAYSLISQFYGERKAERSGVKLIQHIDEGIKILEYISADEDTIAAFCLHPLVQHDDDLEKQFYCLDGFSVIVVAYVMEYRNIANRHLSDNVTMSEYFGYYPRWSGNPIKLSPLKEVNQMLIADKVQNAADFEIYHKGKHERSAELDFYFKTWHNALGVADSYEELKKVAKGIK